MVAIAIFYPSRSAWACHSFSVAANPSTIPEGSTVNVTVTRDAGLASSIKASTVDETAKARQDYTPVNLTINFSPTDTSEMFQIPTSNDNAPESAETFKIHLSDPGECPINTEVGPDARVTIQDNDAAQASPKAPSPGGVAASPSSSPSPGASPPAGQAPSPTGAAVPAPSPTDSPKVLAKPGDRSGGLSGASIVAILGLAVSAAAGGGLWLLRKTPA